jgi:nucleoside-diphosphate-sugar epimerase
VSGTARTIVILGCGTVGCAAGMLLVARGHTVIGIRRKPRGETSLPVHAGDAADPRLWTGLPCPDAVLLTATPGLRRGGDHGLARAAAAIPLGVRVVYSGTTAVYGEADGAALAEDGVLAPDAGPLREVEEAVLAHANALVLRCPALVGPTRLRVQERARAAAAAGLPLTVPGDPDRPFSVLHEDDLALLLAEAVDGRLRDQRGILNAAHPEPLTVRGYYGAQARRAGAEVTIVSDGTVKPSRAIDATRLHRLVPGFAWRQG